VKVEVCRPVVSDGRAAKPARPDDGIASDAVGSRA
jgi:hypothetical protein